MTRLLFHFKGSLSTDLIFYYCGFRGYQCLRLTCSVIAKPLLFSLFRIIYQVETTVIRKVTYVVKEVINKHRFQMKTVLHKTHPFVGVTQKESVRDSGYQPIRLVHCSANRKCGRGAPIIHRSVIRLDRGETAVIKETIYPGDWFMRLWSPTMPTDTFLTQPSLGFT